MFPAVLALALLPWAAVAAPFTVQGSLRTGELPAPDGSYGMVVALYESETAAVPVWFEPVSSVAVENGIFAVTLGDATQSPPPDSVFSTGKAAWIGFKVDNEPELPRRPLTGVPYSVHSSSAGDLLCTGCVSGAELADSLPLAVIRAGANTATLTVGAPDLTFAGAGGATVALDPTTRTVTIGAAVFDPSTLTAASIGLSPVGGLGASNVQDAIGALKLLAGNPTVGFGATHPVPGFDTGETMAHGWTYTGKRIRFIKRSLDTLLEFTVSDTLRVSGNGNWARLEVRLSGASINCYADEFLAVGGSSGNDWHAPYSNICILPAGSVGVGTHEAELWMYSTGGAYEGWSTHELLMVQEITPSDRMAYVTLSGGSGEMTGDWAPVPGRQIDYVKKDVSTALRLTYADTFRGSLSAVANWQYLEVRMDGQMMPQRCYFGRYDNVGNTGGVDFHQPFVTSCVVEAVAPGSHTFSVWRHATGGSSAYVGYTRGAAVLKVEEMTSLPGQWAYTRDGGDVTQYSGDWAQAPGRSLNFTVTAPGETHKVSYSDNLRGGYFCEGGQAFVQLTLDGQPTHCIRGVHHTSGGMNGQDHHMPFHHVCLLQGPAVGTHTLAVQYKTANCGTLALGHMRSSPLLQIERLPPIQ